MIFLKIMIQKFKEWLNKTSEPKYLSGKNRAVKHARDRQRYLSGKNKEKVDDTI
jgi:hypothetical protein